MSAQYTSSENNASKSCAEFRSNVKQSSDVVTDNHTSGNSRSKWFRKHGFSRDKRQQGDQNFSLKDREALPRAYLLLLSYHKGFFLSRIKSHPVMHRSPRFCAPFTLFSQVGLRFFHTFPRVSFISDKKTPLSVILNYAYTRQFKHNILF